MSGRAGISIVVATRNRAHSLRALLASLDQLQPPPLPCEIVIADNGSSDDTPGILTEWRKCSPANRTVLTVPEPGKSRANNAAISLCRGELLAFVDDDVVVDSRYLVGIWSFFQIHDCWAAQGAIAWPEEVFHDPELLDLLECFGGIPRFEPTEGSRLAQLIGANMTVRKEVFDKIGFFDERLGVGAAGFHEDGELARRILSRGGWIGGMPGARVTHEIDRKRLMPEYHHQMCLKEGSSSYVSKPRPRLAWILPKLLLAGLRCVFVSAVGNSQRKYRVLSRWWHYCGMWEMSRENSNRGQNLPS